MLTGSRNFISRIFFALMLLSLASAFPAAGLAAPANQTADAPDISARAAIVVEYPSGRILYSKSMHDKLPPASTTKILTSILAIEHGNLDDTVTVDPADLVGESTMGLEAGEKQTLHNLLYGMLLPSGNDAAMAVARFLGSQDPGGAGKDPIKHFAEMMNARAAQLGLTDSHFITPHGLDTDGHYSSAYDLASLTWYALHFPVFNEVIKTQFYEVPGHPLKNTNEMLTRYEGTDGVKTGWTDAGGLCLVNSATRDGHRLISVVLNAPRWYADSAAILDYGFARLGAAPTDPTAETLSVASRGAANWLLASATSTPPTVPAPVAAGGSEVMKQGGGVAAAGESSAGKGAAKPAGAGAPVSQQAQNSDLQIQAQVLSATTPGTARFSLGTLLWLALIILIGLALSGWYMVSRRGLALSALRFSTPPLSLPGLRDHVPGAAVQPTAPPRTYVTPAPQPARTLGDMPDLRRREPNLLITPEEAGVGHLHRALLLAEEGKQGSSMAEFLMALRLGTPVDIIDLYADGQLPPTAFLALARAQAAAGMHMEAEATLEYGIEVMPGERLLHMTLRQMRGH